MELTQNEALLGGAIVGAGITLFLIIAAIFGILVLIAGWKLFEKAGEKGWKILIPIYNIYIFCKIIGINFWIWVIVLPIVVGVIEAIVENNNENLKDTFTILYSAVLTIYMNYKLAKAFGKGIGYTIGLTLFPNIFQLILGFGSAEYVGIEK